LLTRQDDGRAEAAAIKKAKKNYDIINELVHVFH
jgi:hypothetical protein